VEFFMPKNTEWWKVVQNNWPQQNAAIVNVILGVIVATHLGLLLYATGLNKFFEKKTACAASSCWV